MPSHSDVHALRVAAAAARGLRLRRDVHDDGRVILFLRGSACGVNGLQLGLLLPRCLRGIHSRGGLLLLRRGGGGARAVLAAHGALVPSLQPLPDAFAVEGVVARQLANLLALNKLGEAYHTALPDELFGRRVGDAQTLHLRLRGSAPGKDSHGPIPPDALAYVQHREHDEERQLVGVRPPHHKLEHIPLSQRQRVEEEDPHHATQSERDVWLFTVGSRGQLPEQLPHDPATLQIGEEDHDLIRAVLVGRVRPDARLHKDEHADTDLEQGLREGD
mmetsp:Transcript_66520/g.171200  ORF Transcript_66520/g.171200 Transcript_66520/m.171200 type:complete len:275 (+) Transcript_66520:42-866(+)